MSKKTSETTRNVDVLLFAGLKERLRRDEVSVEVSEPVTVATLTEALANAYPEIADDLPHCRVAVDQTFTQSDAPVPVGVEIAVIPPVSGGHDGSDPGKNDDKKNDKKNDHRAPEIHPNVLLTHSPLQPQAVFEAVAHAGAGGITSFVGNVREQSRGKTVAHLEYEGYGPMAAKVLASIATEIEGRIEGSRVAIHHRLGTLAIGEAAVAIAASAPHRAEAFEACRDAIEALKKDVPIWKKEVATDGAEWIGRGP